MGTEDGRSGILMVRVAGPGRSRFRIDSGGTALGWAEPGGTTPVVLAPGTHRIRLRAARFVRTNAVDVNVPAGGRVRVELRNTYLIVLLLVPIAVAVFFGRTYGLGAMALFSATLHGVPGVTVRLRVVEP
ncbi:hypothetical protein ACFV6F_25240 [Kitasatospora phosalacinea]|uniref:hypothetical protein n=1 Tax=Kitasatospora phosalacinea TaxID=2065 RepID=UPI0036624EC8